MRWDKGQRVSDEMPRTRPVGTVTAQSGQSMVEMALLLPVLLLIVLVVVDLGPMFFAHETISSSAHAGALYGSYSQGAAVQPTAIAQVALSGTEHLLGYSQASPTPNPYVLSVPEDLDSNGTIDRITVTVTYKYKPLFPYPFVPDEFDFSQTAIMRVRQ